MNNHVIHSQGREIIYKIYQFMKREKEVNNVVIPLNNLLDGLEEGSYRLLDE
jgi:hypothetical protein